MPIDKEKFKQCRTEDEYLIAKYLYVPLSNFLSRILIRFPITPNQLTIFWGLMMVVCSIAFVFGDYVLSILAGVGWIVAYSLDESDGTIARYKGIFSKRGKFYDLINHRVSYPLLMFCIGIGLWHMGVDDVFGIEIRPVVFMIAGFLAGLGMLIIMDLGDCYNKAYPESKVDNDKGSMAVEGRNMDRKTFVLMMSLNPLSFLNMMFLLPIFAALNCLHVFILFYGTLYPLAAFYRYTVLARSIPPRIEQ